jgi:hypothetical protein
MLNPGNYEVAFPTVTAEPHGFECVLLNVPEIRIRPLDGQCSAESDEPGALCGKDLDCPNGTCQGVEASFPASEELIENLGISVVLFPGVNAVSFTGQGCNKVTPPQPARALPLVTVSTGNYLFERLTIANPQFVRPDGTVARCNGSIQLTEAFTKDQLTFFIGSGRSNTVSLVLDVDAAAVFLPSPPGSCTQFGLNVGSFLAIVPD